MDRRKRVLNFSEVAVDRVLAEYAAENDYRISPKMRLRDVIDVDDLPLDRRARNFAFTSHLDFVASDVGSHLPGARRRVGRPAASDRSDLTTSVTWAEQELKGFSQVAAQPGETVQVELAIPASRCTLVTAENCTVVEPGVLRAPGRAELQALAPVGCDVPDPRLTRLRAAVISAAE